MFITWKLKWMKILFKLTFKREVFTTHLEYNCFDYFFQILFVNITVWILLWMLTVTLALLWIFLWISPTLKCYDSQDLKEKLKLMGRVMKFFSKKLLGHEIFSSMVPWATLQNIFLKICKTLHPHHPPPSTYLMYTP